MDRQSCVHHRSRSGRAERTRGATHRTIRELDPHRLDRPPRRTAPRARAGVGVSRSKTRAQQCDRADAKVRLAHGRKFLEVAKLVEGEDVEESASVAASLAVLAGIAAADAACC